MWEPEVIDQSNWQLHLCSPVFEQGYQVIAEYLEFPPLDWDLQKVYKMLPHRDKFYQAYGLYPEDVVAVRVYRDGIVFSEDSWQEDIHVV
jgi:hypothetical protein